ncbi:stage V sporulation protein AB [Thermotalea metallivorans]|uniref:Stage V sporulation protein AB n=1 Tax=Thermotalea metallivorans TaxID=520762 RepID=A0A140L0Y5_9FIRM|nr:stage V sporulation protein AB [Thermotalea metallivorans]KXG74210.1 hypothetical protein AN619_25280 [Thermotalea metallivorans]
MLKLVSVFVGLAEGIVVGSAIVAFITLLDIVPRLAQLTGTENYIRWYERVIIISGMIVSLSDFLEISVKAGRIAAIGAGLLMGIFVGLLASALAEVTNVIPVIVNRFKLHAYVGYILMTLAAGKVVGSLLYWIMINK